jgi:hypothetical protein
VDTDAREENTADAAEEEDADEHVEADREASEVEKMEAPKDTQDTERTETVAVAVSAEVLAVVVEENEKAEEEEEGGGGGGGEEDRARAEAPADGRQCIATLCEIRNRRLCRGGDGSRALLRLSGVCFSMCARCGRRRCAALRSARSSWDFA